MESTTDELRAALATFFGPPRRYENCWSWLLDRKLGIEVQVRTDQGRCQVWAADPMWPEGPRLFMVVDSPAHVDATVTQVCEYLKARRARTHPAS